MKPPAGGPPAAGLVASLAACAAAASLAASLAACAALDSQFPVVPGKSAEPATTPPAAVCLGA